MIFVLNKCFDIHCKIIDEGGGGISALPSNTLSTDYPIEAGDPGLGLMPKYNTGWLFNFVFFLICPTEQKTTNMYSLASFSQKKVSVDFELSRTRITEMACSLKEANVIKV